jgi:hypothetical protein
VLVAAFYASHEQSLVEDAAPKRRREERQTVLAGTFLAAA